MRKNDAFDAKIVNTRLTKIFIAIFAPDERLPSSATLPEGCVIQSVSDKAQELMDSGLIYSSSTNSHTYNCAHLRLTSKKNMTTVGRGDRAAELTGNTWEIGRC